MAENKELNEGISRRSFLSAGAMMAGAVAAMGVNYPTKAFAAEEAVDVEQIEISSITGWTGTPKELEEMGWSTMPLADLNECRRQYIDQQTEYVCEDGTVIPEAIVKARALIHTFGMGCGNTPEDTTWDDMLVSFTEEQAEAFLDMPWGEEFTAYDLYAKGGRTLDECKEVCDHLADRGYLARFTRNIGISYHHVPYFQGVVEYHFTEATETPGYNIGVSSTDMLVEGPTGVSDMRDGGSPTFYAMPCDKSVTTDGEVLPYDDIVEKIKTKNTLAIAPCYCRYTALLREGVEDAPTFEDFATGEFEEYFSPVCDQRVETCLMMGDEAEYWIEMGWARQITQEDAIRYMERSRDDGFILESCFAKDSETICSCHMDTCGIIAEWMAIGDADAIGAANAFKRISNYNLEVNFDDCIKCGTCANRCPLHAITMDGEDGAPQVNAMCFRCGQCAWVCPQDARKLALRPEEERFDLPRNFLDDNNMKAAYRFEHGLIK